MTTTRKTITDKESGSFLYEAALQALRDRTLDWVNDDICVHLITESFSDEASRLDSDAQFATDPAELPGRRVYGRTAYCYGQSCFKVVPAGLQVLGLLIFRRTDGLLIAKISQLTKDFAVTNGGEIYISWHRPGVFTLTEDELGRSAIE